MGSTSGLKFLEVASPGYTINEGIPDKKQIALLGLTPTRELTHSLHLVQAKKFFYFQRNLHK